ncbi:MAG: lipopolysaccharide kinase InaA family protein [Pseudomonadales bacterium]
MKTLSAENLINAGRIIDPPFKLIANIAGAACELEFSKVLRLLPGKRLVGVARVDGNDMLAKVYVGRSAARYARRERQGVRLIADSGVRTPLLKWHAPLMDGKGEVLAFEFLPDAVSLFERWREAQQEEARIDVLTRAMVIIGKLHNQGVVQNDIHLANFLMSNGRLYTIDGGDIVRRSHPPLAERSSLRNVGMFFAQFFPRYDHLVEIVLPAYEAVRGWDMQPTRLEDLAREIETSRSRRKRLCIDKAFRDCTRFVCNKSLDRFVVCDRDAYTYEMEQVLADPDEFMVQGQTLKDSPTSTVAIVAVSGRSLVIKRYNMKNFWHRIKRAFRRSRAWKSWANACRMEVVGIPSVKPVALVEHRIGPLRGKAYFITEYVAGPDALASIRNLGHPNGELEALTSILQELADSQISHGDMKATNFVMAEQGPVILDLDAMKEHGSRASFRRAFQRDIKRFMQNWQDRPEIASRFEGLLGNLNY